MTWGSLVAQSWAWEPPQGPHVSWDLASSASPNILEKLGTRSSGPGIKDMGSPIAKHSAPR